MVEKFPRTSYRYGNNSICRNLTGNEKLEIEDDTLQVLPQHFGGDGFFVAAFRKKEVIKV